MKFCTGHNFTLLWSAYLSFNTEYAYRDPKDDIPKGPLVNHFAGRLFLDDFEKTRENCKYVWSYGPGRYYRQNDSYDGAISLLVEGKADISVRPTSYDIGLRFVDLTSPISSDYCTITQALEKKQKSNDLISTLSSFIPSTSFAVIVVLGLICNFVFPLIFSFLSKKLKISSLSRQSWSFCFTIFIWFLIQLFNSDMNTTNVIVDTSDLLYPKDKLITSNRTPCFMDDSSDTDFILETRENGNSLLRKLAEKVKKGGICFLFKENKLGVSKELLKTAFLLHPVFLKEMFSKAAKQGYDKETFTSPDYLYETLYALGISKKMSKEKKKFIYNW